MRLVVVLGGGRHVVTLSAVRERFASEAPSWAPLEACGLSTGSNRGRGQAGRAPALSTWITLRITSWSSPRSTSMVSPGTNRPAMISRASGSWREALDGALERAGRRRRDRSPCSADEVLDGALAELEAELPLLSADQLAQPRELDLDDLAGCAARSSRWNTMMSSMRFKNSGLNEARSASVDRSALHLGLVEVRRVADELGADVARSSRTTVLRKFDRPARGHRSGGRRRAPASRTLNTSGCAFSISSKSTTAVGPAPHRLGELAALVVADVARAGRR